MALYLALEPFISELLDVGDGHRIYWEECGNPEGKPAVFLHGGPGGGCVADQRRFWDPARYRILLLDQRGCGRSLPHASAADSDLSTNTTWHLVADLERLREHRGIDRWQVVGGSWGSALALAYTEAWPERVSELIVRGVFTLRRSELDFYYNGAAGQLFPERYELFLAPLGGRTFRGNAIAAYHDLLSHPDPAVHGPAAVAWTTWEAATINLETDEDLIAEFSEPAFALAFARIENHYFRHGGWFRPGQLLEDADRLAGVPGLIVQGRYDVATPAVTAYELHRVWPRADFEIITLAGHSGSQLIWDSIVSATDRFAS